MEKNTSVACHLLGHHLSTSTLAAQTKAFFLPQLPTAEEGNPVVPFIQTTTTLLHIYVTSKGLSKAMFFFLFFI